MENKEQFGAALNLRAVSARRDASLINQAAFQHSQVASSRHGLERVYRSNLLVHNIVVNPPAP